MSLHSSSKSELQERAKQLSRCFDRLRQALSESSDFRGVSAFVYLQEACIESWHNLDVDDQEQLKKELEALEVSLERREPGQIYQYFVEVLKGKITKVLDKDNRMVSTQVLAHIVKEYKQAGVKRFKISCPSLAELTMVSFNSIPLLGILPRHLRNPLDTISPLVRKRSITIARNWLGNVRLFVPSLSYLRPNPSVSFPPLWSGIDLTSLTERGKCS